MSAFKELRDVSNTFEEQLRRLSDELFTANINESFVDGMAKKLQDLNLYTSKLRLLQAKRIAASPQIASQQTEETATVSDYTDAVTCKLVQQRVVKSIFQSDAVKALITANDSSLTPEMMERKQQIVEQLARFKDKEMELMQLDVVLAEREARLDDVRREWDEQLRLLRELTEEAGDTGQANQSGQLFVKFHSLESKVRLIRALLARLACRRGDGYDWETDPHGRLRALQLARE